MPTTSIDIDAFHEDMIPTLVGFVASLGIEPAHHVLDRAPDYAPLVAESLDGMEINGPEDHIWLLTRIAMFVGEIQVQRHRGHWFVNEIAGSRFEGRIVVGAFQAGLRANAMVDPFEVARDYVDAPPPRDLLGLIAEVDREMHEEPDPA